MQRTQRCAHPILQPVALIIICLTAGCSRPNETRSEIARPVKTMVVAAGDQSLARTFPGKVEASKTVELAFQVPGLLVKLPVKEGQKVAKGEVVAQLRQDEFQARLQIRTRPTRSGPGYPQCTPAWGTSRRATSAGGAVKGGRGEAGERQDGIRSLREAGQDECCLTRGIRTVGNRLSRCPGRAKGGPPIG